MNCIFQTDVVIVSVKERGIRKRKPCMIISYLFSKKVFAFTIFFPIALAFQAQKDPDGST